MSKGKSIYFTEKEIRMILEYIGESISLLSESENTSEKVEKDMENGLGSALRKLCK